MANDKCGRFARSASLDAAALQELLIAIVIKKRRLRNPEGTGEKRQGLLSDPALSTLNIADLILREANQICQGQLAQPFAQTKLSDTNAKFWLNYFHNKKCGEFDNFRTPSDITGYDLYKLGVECAFEGGSGEKSKKSFTGIPRVIENDSMDSKEGALSPRSTRLKKSIEMSRSSENCS
jgi:hypothetical protein